MRLGRAARALSRWHPPTWLLGVLVALLGWKVAMTPPSVGLDSSWNGGLAMAVHDGLRWGDDIVFTYGPLGFMNGRAVWFGDLGVIALVYGASLSIAFCVALVWALRRTLPALPAAAVAFLVITVLPLIEESIVLGALIAIGALARERSERVVNALVVGGATFGAIEVLIKFSAGPVIAAFFLIALVGLRARWWQVAGYLALLAAEVLGLWLITGQSLGQVPDFLRNTYEIVSGFSAAMITSTDVPAWQVTAATVAAIAIAIGVVVASYRGSYRDRRARWAGVALMALASFTVFKEGVVRTDAGHLSLFFSTICILWIAIPWARARWYWLLAGTAVIVAVGWPVRPEGQTNNTDVVANVEQAWEQVRNLASPSRRQALTESGRGAMAAAYRLEPAALAALRGHTVTVEPWEIGAAWAYGLDWKPLPVFQNYSAYTSQLDRLNSEALANPDGPERILRENVGLVNPEFPTRTIDGRFPGWDPPEQARTALCDFAVVEATARWQVLARTPDRCGPSRPLGSVEASPGEAVDVPAPGPNEVVWARIDGVEVSGLERLTALLAHPRTRHAIVNGDRSFRLIAATAADGLMLRGSNGIGGKGAFAQIPQARTIAVTGAGGDLRFEFFAMPVRAPALAPGQ
ncbi:MAG TPA: hypothetical protein VGO36_07730 [Solirubrobacterales bacterium]|nr:hypothetical protein [Solirubrobacterales bacterium]